MTSDAQARLDAIRQRRSSRLKHVTLSCPCDECSLDFTLDLLARQSEALEVVTAERDMWRDQLRGERQAQETLRQERDRYEAELVGWNPALTNTPRSDRTPERILRQFRADLRSWLEERDEAITRAESAERDRATLQAQLVAAQEALRFIAEDNSECDCEHDDEDCCMVQPCGYCSRCYAAVALRSAPRAQS